MATYDHEKGKAYFDKNDKLKSNIDNDFYDEDLLEAMQNAGYIKKTRYDHVYKAKKELVIDMEDGVVLFDGEVPEK